MTTTGTSDDREKAGAWLDQHRPRFETMLELLDPEPGDRILDVGIDPPHFSRMILEREPDVKLYGIGLPPGPDTIPVHESTVDVSRINADSDPWRTYRDGSFDAVVLGAVVEHLFDPRHVLSEAHRVTDKPAGRLVLSTPNAVRLKKRVDVIRGRNPWDGFADDDDELAKRYHRHNHEWTLRELIDILKVTRWGITHIRTPTLSRPGLLGRLYEMVAGSRRSLSDQIVIRAIPVNKIDYGKRPETYRPSLVSRDREGSADE